MSKRLLALFLAITCMFVMTVSAFAEEATTETTQEVEVNVNEEVAVKLLTDIGIIKADDNVSASSNVTRAFAAAVTARLLGIGEIGTIDTPFSDVPSSNLYSGAIVAVGQMGVMEGHGDGTFGPDEELTYSQIVKIVVEALGYGLHAEQAGGYPSGHLIKATQLGVLKGVSAVEGPVTAGRMALILKNAIDTEVMVGSRIKTGYYEKVTEGGTLAYEYLGISKIKGQVTGTYYTAFRTNRNLLKGEVAIEGIPMNIGTTDVEAYFGMNVEAYYKTEEFTDELVLAAVIPDKRAVVYEFDTDMVAPAPTTTATSVTYYDENDQKVTVAIDPTHAFVSNGTALFTPVTVADLTTAGGVVKLIAPMGDTVKVVIIDRYVNGIVDIVDTEESRVYFKNPVDGSTVLTLDDASTTVKTQILNADGTVASISDLAEFDVLSITKSAGFIKAIRSNNRVRGTVNELSADGSKVTIEGETYDVAANLLDMTNDLEKIQLGIDATFHTDYTGKIAVIASKSVTGAFAPQYGYLVAGTVKPGLNNQAQLKLFTQEAEFVTFTLPEKIIFNGTRVDSTTIFDPASPLMTGDHFATETLDILKYNKTNVLRTERLDNLYQSIREPGTIYEQLLKYKVNSEGVITEIETAKAFDDPLVATPQGRDKYFSVDNTIDIHSSSPISSLSNTENTNAAYYRSLPLGRFDPDIFLRATTKIFLVPAKYNGANEALYEVKTYDNLEHSAGDFPETLFYNMHIFDIDAKTRIAGALVDKDNFYDGAAGGNITELEFAGNYSALGIVTDISKGLDSKEENVTFLTLSKINGSTQKVMVPENTVLKFWDDTRKGVISDPAKEDAAVKNDDGTLKTIITPDQLDRGDVIQYTTRSSGSDLLLATANVLLRVDARPDKATTGTPAEIAKPLERGYEDAQSLRQPGKYSGYKASVYTYGLVTSVCPETFIVDTGYSRAYPFAGVACLLYDTKKDTIRPITYASIRANEDYAFVHLSKRETRLILVIR